MTTANIANEAQCLWVDYQGTPYPAQLVGYDDVTNISILRLANPPSNIEFLHLAESMTVPEPATMLLAVTCQLGMNPGPSMGIVTGWHTAFFEQVFPTTVLRTSIPSDGGEDGSPVFDLKTGDFVGVMISSVENIRSSFILPARAVMRIRDDLVFSGKVSYALFGIELDKDASIAARSIIIGRAVDDAPAYDAGVKPGDALLEFDGAPINHVMDLHNATFFARPGQLLSIKVRREGKELTLPVRMIEKSRVLWNNDQIVIAENSSPNQESSNKTLSASTPVPKAIEKVVRKNNVWHNYFKN